MRIQLCIYEVGICDRFPVKDVQTWLIDDNAGPRQPPSATEGANDDASAPQPTMQPSEGTEEYVETDVTEQPTTSELETSEAERFEEQEVRRLTSCDLNPNETKICDVHKVGVCRRLTQELEPRHWLCNMEPSTVRSWVAVQPNCLSGIQPTQPFCSGPQGFRWGLHWGCS